jgi:hypothetical protein
MLFRVSGIISGVLMSLLLAILILPRSATVECIRQVRPQRVCTWACLKVQLLQPGAAASAAEAEGMKTLHSFPAAATSAAASPWPVVQSQVAIACVPPGRRVAGARAMHDPLLPCCALQVSIALKHLADLDQLVWRAVLEGQAGQAGQAGPALPTIKSQAQLS